MSDESRPISDRTIVVNASAAWCRTPLGAGAIAALLLLGMALRVVNLNNVAFRTPDERVYTWQATVVLHSGSAGLRQLVSEYQHNPSLAFCPPPTRAGYIWLLATVMRGTGTTDERAGAYISCTASIGSLFVLTLMGIRFVIG